MNKYHPKGVIKGKLYLGLDKLHFNEVYEVVDIDRTDPENSMVVYRKRATKLEKELGRSYPLKFKPETWFVGAMKVRIKIGDGERVIEKPRFIPLKEEEGGLEKRAKD